MRTNIVIDDDLMQRASNLSGLSTKREIVEAGLRLLVQLKQQEKNPFRSRQAQIEWRFIGITH